MIVYQRVDYLWLSDETDPHHFTELPPPSCLVKCTELGLRLTGSEPNTAMYCFWRASFRDHGFAERNMKNHMFMMKHRKNVLPHDGFVRFFPQSLKTRQLAGSSGGTNASPMNFAWSLRENFSDMPDDEQISRHMFFSAYCCIHLCWHAFCHVCSRNNLDLFRHISEHWPWH